MASGEAVEPGSFIPLAESSASLRLTACAARLRQSYSVPFSFRPFGLLSQLPVTGNLPTEIFFGPDLTGGL